MKERKYFERGGLAASVDPAKCYSLANATITVNGEVEKFLQHYGKKIKSLDRVYWSDWVKWMDQQKQIMAMVKDPATGRRLDTFEQWVKIIWPLSQSNVGKL